MEDSYQKKTVSRQRLIIVSNFAAFYAGNFIASLSALERAVKEIGISVEYVFPKNAIYSNWGENGRYAENHVIHTADFHPKELAFALKDIVSQPKQKVHTIVHMHFLDYKTIGAINRALRHDNCSMIVQEHMRIDFAQKPKNSNLTRRIKDVIKRMLYKYNTAGCRLIGVSDAVYQDLCAIRGNSTKIYMVRNAISTDRLNDSVHLDNILGLDSLHDVVIFGTHFNRKGVDIALRAVMMAGNNLRLVILAHNEEETEEKLDSIDSKWCEYAAVYHVVKDVSGIYNHSLCFISPSRSEAFGYAVAEAAYCETQVIASDIPGQNTMKCIPGIMWVHPERADELADAIAKCYKLRRDNQDQLNHQKTIQQAYIIENFGLKKWCEDIIKLYSV